MTSSFSGLSRVILNSPGVAWGVGEAWVDSPLGFRVELTRITPNAITRPNVIPATTAQMTSLRISLVNISYCEKIVNLLEWDDYGDKLFGPLKL